MIDFQTIVFSGVDRNQNSFFSIEAKLQKIESNQVKIYSIIEQIKYADKYKEK